LARAQAVDAEDLILMLNPPNAELLLAHLKQRQAAQAEMQKEMMAAGMMPGASKGGGKGSRTH
jgi:hypothetical protein